MEAGMVEHCPKCKKANVIPNPEPTPHPVTHASEGGGAARPHGLPAMRSFLVIFFGGLALGAGIILALDHPRRGRPIPPIGIETPAPVATPVASATQESHPNDAQAQLWDSLRARLEKEIETAKQAAGRAERNLTSLLEDGNFAYLPSAPAADPNGFRPLTDIRRLSVVFTGSEGLEATLGVRDLKPVLETALREAGFTIDAARPDAQVLCHVSLITLQATADSDALVYCLVECGVARQVYVPKVGYMARAIVWMTSAVGMEGSPDIPRSVESPKDAVAKAIADLLNALSKGKALGT
jgi:hypothetical protein